MTLHKFFQPENVSIQKVHYAGLIFDVLRLDKIHTTASGNKFFKLKHNMLEAKNQEKEVLLTFGGAFSNHIISTAFAAKACGFSSIGIIRGEEIENPVLSLAKEQGMQLEFVSREQYRDKYNPGFIQELRARHGDFYLIPEGGTNHLAVKGTEEINDLIPSVYDLICISVGTGGTIAGLINSKKEHQRILGFSALKGSWIEKEVDEWINGENNWQINQENHFGGYAKWKPELIDFINDFYQKTGIPLDPVYNGKMMYGLLNLWKKGEISSDHNVLAIHTGGLQGIIGFNHRFGNLINT
ncbi:pyridoxal-phosphate dependent enzyme [Marivirga sp. S37H4]|uniref:Pyridoxal-phosphate dependent enzyme n=1 Tax=Marivirga aurantiaca TaxID=2802615 RepID=A0A934WZM9_9BACT|nr:pyridoxal-phosphate dependent enzyme [Marivirga aurantiaca]MBK6265711.1 pyridoxal-phosphate dependent enzyme [Marivirga aurantiaca]